MDGFVGLADYPVGSAVHDMMSGDTMATLQKALTTESGIVTAGLQGGQTFRVQSLEQTLKLATEKSEKQLPLWSSLKKDPAMSTVLEFTRQDNWGDEQSLFVDEIGSNLAQQEATYTRLAAMVKFMAIKKEVSHASTLVQSIVDPMAQKAHEGTMQLLRAVERALAYGDSGYGSAATAHNTMEFDGFLKQIADVAYPSGVASTLNSDIVIDWAGNPPTEDMLENAGKVIDDHVGELTKIVFANAGKRDLTRAMFPYQRVNQPIANPDGTYGTPLNNYVGSWSEMVVQASRYLTPKRPRAVASAFGGSGTTPLAPAATGIAAADSASALEAKPYYYWVSELYNGRESLPYLPSGVTGVAVTPAVGEKVTLTITWNTATYTTGLYANVYRSTVNDWRTATLIGQVCYSGATNPFVDRNGVDHNLDGYGSYRDNCTDAIGFTWDPEVVTARQLAPLMKMDLAQTTIVLPFLVLLYMVPILFVPTKCVHIKNIGPMPAG
jgi:hypothetical protein